MIGCSQLLLQLRERERFENAGKLPTYFHCKLGTSSSLRCRSSLMGLAGIQSCVRN